MPRTRIYRSLRAVVALALLAGCGSVGSTNLTEMEKAKLIKEKRGEARDVLAKWSAGDAQDVKLLQRYVDLHRETTEVAPATCPRCWAAYAEALSTMGWYYWGIYRDVLDEAEAAKSRGDADSLKAEAEEYKEKWMHYFTLSNQAYETHFRSPEVAWVHPYSYERVMRHYEEMENYERAVVYLQKYLDSYPSLDEVNREKIEKLRRLYKQEITRQKERGIRPNERVEPRKKSPIRGGRGVHARSDAEKASNSEDSEE